MRCDVSAFCWITDKNVKPNQASMEKTSLLQKLEPMGVTIALKSAFEPGVLQDILSFLDDSSHVAICGTDTNDIANVADLDHVDLMTFGENIWIQIDLYQKSATNLFITNMIMSFRL